MFNQFMIRSGLAIFMVLGSSLAVSAVSPIEGSYLETRTCQVYTGPCFANSETGLTGRDAIMAWHIQSGSHNGVDVAGLSVVLVLNASDTLAFQGLEDAAQIRSVILVDDRGSDQQQQALVDFAKSHSGKAAQSIVRVDARPIEMSLDVTELNGKLAAGREVKLTTRKARPGDCICSNEVAYYPPLAKVNQFAPGVTIEGEFRGKGLGTQWSTPGYTAYMATFSYE